MLASPNIGEESDVADKCPSVDVTLKGEPAKVLDEVKKLGAKNGVDIVGDASKGTIKHKTIAVSGTYTVSGQKVTIAMVDDTWLIDCKKLNAMVADFFKGK